MLIRLRVRNLLSFGSETEFSLSAGKITKKHKNHIRRVGRTSILRGCAVFGPNAAGKSNLLTAIALIERMMIDNSCAAVAGRQFRLSKKIQPDIGFDIEYEYNEHIFRYEIVTDGSVVKKEILSCLDSDTPEVLYSRIQGNMVLGTRLKDYLWYEQRTCKDNAFYLMKLAQDGLRENRKTIPESKIMLDACWGMKQFIVIDASRQTLLGDKYYAKLQMEDFRKFLVSLLNWADVGISEVSYRKVMGSEADSLLLKYRAVIPDDLHDGWSRVVLESPSYYLLISDGTNVSVSEICCKHGDHFFRASEESQGTIKLIQLSSLLYQLKTSKMAWFVDEFDSKLHTLISQALLKWYMNTEEAISSQLIVAVHDTNLFTHDIWRTDEICLVTKDKNVHSSKVLRLDSLSPRFDKRLAKGYMNGEYGSLPRLGAAKF